MATVYRAPPTVLQFFNNLGLPNVAGTLLTQVGGTNYPTYQDSAGTTPLPNPIPLNSRGEVSNASGASCELFLLAGVQYTFTLFDANSNQIGVYPNIVGINDPSFSGTSSPALIVVIGDSLVSQQTMLDQSAPMIVENRLRQQGMNCQVLNCGQSGLTFYRANNNAVYGSRTCVQEAIALNPAIVIVNLGANDTINLVDNRSLVQVEADANTLFTTLAAGLPTAKIMYGSEVWFDQANLTSPSTLIKNQYLLPQQMTLNAPGILANYWCPEMLTQDVHTLTLAPNGFGQLYSAAYGNWNSLDTYIKALPSVTTSFIWNWWKMFRLGGGSQDGQHPNRTGHIISSGYVSKGMRAAAWFSTLFPNAMQNNQQAWYDPDYLFSQLMTASADAWVPAASPTISPQSSTDVIEAFNLITILNNQLDPVNWFMPYRFKVTLAGGTLTNDNTYNFTWLMQGAPANTLVNYSEDGGAWTSTTVTTDAIGQAIRSSPVVSRGETVAAHTIRYAVGNVSCPSLSYTISAASPTPGTFSVLTASTSLQVGGGTIVSTMQGNTFTPTLASSGGGTPTYTSQYGYFFQFGPYVFFQCRIVLATTGTLAAGNLTVAGLPVATNATAANFPAFATVTSAMAATAATEITSGAINGATSINLNKFAAGVQSTLTVADLTGTSVIAITGIYQV